MSIKQGKAEVRKVISAALSKVSQDSIKRQSSLIHSKLLSIPEYQNAKSLSIFMSMPTGEVSTGPIVRQALNQGKSVFIPFLRGNEGKGEPKSVMDMVELYSEEDFEQLAPDKWGIPSMKKDAVLGRPRCPGDRDSLSEAAELNVVVMPGVAFDKKLQRIGHGKGYYDFFLERYQRYAESEDKVMPFLVAIALEQQLLPDGQDVPTDSSDWPLDALIVGDGSILRR